MISAQHLRMARAGLGWTLIDLSEHSGVNPNTISRYEGGQEGLVSKWRKLEGALQAAGVVFIEDGGKTVTVRLPLLDDGKKGR
jgi:transcriptional regulator with XRE-family HTH domain